MSWQKPQFYISVAEYLASEKDSPVRHGYVDGQMYALADASDRHTNVFHLAALDQTPAAAPLQ
jgi:hypothetical protein